MVVKFDSLLPLQSMQMIPRAKCHASCCAVVLAILAAQNVFSKTAIPKCVARCMLASESLSEQSRMAAKASPFSKVLEYIHAGWDELSRSVD
ncbi:MAG TPA: hypothetical protein VJN90_08605, partial [Candidatus Acidoferrales bacterium]|nr:hypothetical protein [Candidatus Acidoferrales bacterium]